MPGKKDGENRGDTKFCHRPEVHHFPAIGTDAAGKAGNSYNEQGAGSGQQGINAQQVNQYGDG